MVPPTPLLPKFISVKSLLKLRPCENFLVDFCTSVLLKALKFESSALAFVCFEISTLLKLEISSFRRVENFKLQKG